MELEESDCVNYDDARTVCEDNVDQAQCNDVDEGDVCCSEQLVVKLPPVVHGDLPIMNNLLSYVVYSLQNSLNDIKNAVLGFYNIEDVMKAIDLLWERVGTDVIGVRPRRRGGSNRQKESVVSGLTGCFRKARSKFVYAAYWSQCA